MIKKVLAGALTAWLVMSTIAFATMEYDRFEGNDSNHPTHKHENLIEYKIDPSQANKTYLIADGKIQILTDLENKIADIKILGDGIDVEFVHMKGGNAFGCYDFEGGLLSEKGDEVTGLMCPPFQKDNKPGDKYTEYPEISHITIYWKEVELPDTGGTNTIVVVMAAMGGIATGFKLMKENS